MGSRSRTYAFCVLRCNAYECSPNADHTAEPRLADGGRGQNGLRRRVSQTKQVLAPTIRRHAEIQLSSGPGDLYYPNGGLFTATNFPVSVYIGFAYKMSNNQMKVLLRVGSRTGAVLRRFGLSVAPRFLWECLTSRTVSRFPAPASSNPACGFPALGFPARFAIKGYETYPAGCAFGDDHGRRSR